jgi:beta-lactamase class C
MIRSDSAGAALAILCGGVLLALTNRAAGASTDIEAAAAQAIPPVMERYGGIPGMAVGIVTADRTVVYNRGVASKATGQAVTGDTLFEIGSVSKTFTATLASFAQVSGKLSLSDEASQYFPALHGSAFDRVSLLNLGTHTPGGLPLQVPDSITDSAQLMAYFHSGSQCDGLAFGRCP